MTSPSGVNRDGWSLIHSCAIPYIDQALFPRAICWLRFMSYGILTETAFQGFRLVFHRQKRTVWKRLVLWFCVLFSEWLLVDQSCGTLTKALLKGHTLVTVENAPPQKRETQHTKKYMCSWQFSSFGVTGFVLSLARGLPTARHPSRQSLSRGRSSLICSHWPAPPPGVELDGFFSEWLWGGGLKTANVTAHRKNFGPFSSRL